MSDPGYPEISRSEKKYFYKFSETGNCGSHLYCVEAGHESPSNMVEFKIDRKVVSDKKMLQLIG